MPPRRVRPPRVHRPPSAVRCFTKEGSWSFCFAGAGFLGLYHVGVTQCLQERAPRILHGARCFYGSSSGALHAVCVISSKSAEYGCFHLLSLQKQVEELSLGIFHPAFMPIEHIRQQLQKMLPSNVHILASKRLGISLTRWYDRQNVIITDFASREEIIQALVCSMYFPFYCGLIPPEFRGERYIDGALSNNLPFSHCPATITVSPFHGNVDICPESNLNLIKDHTTINNKLQAYALNLIWGVASLMPPNLEVVADSCRQGYLDTLRFLERHGVTKEPVMWTLVCEKPVSTADRSQAACRGRDEKEELTVDLAVPSMQVQDVSDFTKLSPELEAALQKACTRDSCLWAHFWRSRPGKTLTYLLLPCVLPFEYIYFRSKRLLIWLPEVPADFRWMHCMLTDASLHICSRTKSQLLRLLSACSPAHPVWGSSALEHDHQSSLPIRPEGTRLDRQ
ncbi:patatin-like phospholipase domain-containing protein 5 [Erinaceus europaeus]|uniref:Patatin-like phospholipase domain-containing protein 5 n=1 Tax=Erinaceus europaeus TaxID=9365 RepID=A0ABM3XDF6_ERIEU|nr:patatin-like phospholipase domain-containing protein 5 [Erinaceus europaeus]